MGLDFFDKNDALRGFLVWAFYVSIPIATFEFVANSRAYAILRRNRPHHAQ